MRTCAQPSIWMTACGGVSQPSNVERMEDDSPVRASPEERQAAEETLKAAVTEGRITLDEFGDRIGTALASTSRKEVAALTADLPAVPLPAAQARSSKWILSIFGGADRSGRWKLATKCWVINIMGGADLDLRAATISGPVTEITVISVMGGSDIIVPDGVEVELGGFALFGGNDLHLADTPAPPGAPLVRIRALSFIGGSDVKRA